jgi:hypothetical protein
MTRRRFAFSVAASAGLISAVNPETRLYGETARDRAGKIIDKTIYALGGDAFRNMRTRTEMGRAYSFYREQLSGLAIARIYTKYLQPSSGAAVAEVQRQVFGKQQEDAIIFTTTDAYEVTYRGAKPLADDRVQQFRETTLQDIFYILRQRLNEPGIEFESQGADVVENQPVETVNVYDSQNHKVTVWINSDTFLPAKQSFQRWDPIVKDRREEVTRYSKYRDVGDGVMWPYSIERERDGEKIFQLYSERVTTGEALSDSMFQLPSGLRILKK